jgi:uncharacterized protein
MEFLLLGYDGTDPGAPERRQAVRADHLEHARNLKQQGKLVLGGAILDDNGQMVGSAMVFDVESEAEFREILARDPYLTGKVWEDIQVKPFRVAKHI